VPGASPHFFPEINHPNWAVVVTSHSALGYENCLKVEGTAADVIKVRQQRKTNSTDSDNTLRSRRDSIPKYQVA